MIKTKKKLIKREAVKHMYEVLYAYIDKDTVLQLHEEFNSIIKCEG